MAYPHVIRLRGPWEYQPLARQVKRPDGAIVETVENLPPPGRVKLPATWEDTFGRGFHGRVLLRRRFGRPGQLDPHERMWLVVESPGPDAEFRINGRRLDAPADIMLNRQFEITELVQDSNHLELVIGDGLPGLTTARAGVAYSDPSRFPEVWLEIRTTHFVDRLCVDAGPSGNENQACEIHVTGQVIGEPAEDLALVATFEGRELAYHPVSAEGVFDLTVVVDGLLRKADVEARNNLPQLEIKLIRGGVRLWEQTCPLRERGGD